DHDELCFKENINIDDLKDDIEKILIKYNIIKDKEKIKHTSNKSKQKMNNNTVELDDDDDDDNCDKEIENIKAEVLSRIKEENKKKAKRLQNKDIKLTKKLVLILSKKRAKEYWD